MIAGRFVAVRLGDLCISAPAVVAASIAGASIARPSVVTLVLPDLLAIGVAVVRVRVAAGWRAAIVAGFRRTAVSVAMVAV